jgi:cysteine desulfurase
MKQPWPPSQTRRSIIIEADSIAAAKIRSNPAFPSLHYFDHNSTTPLAPEVAAALSAAQQDVFGNPSSTHRAGQLARQALEESRRGIANTLRVSPAEIVFTSGGTESNNLAILGLYRHLPKPAHAVALAIEHPSVLEPLRQLQSEGISVTYAKNVESVAAALRDDTALVSVMHANNETGAVQPVEEIARLVTTRRAAGQTIYFHSDGVQAFGKIRVDLAGVDLYSLSAHKIFGPKGIGALFVRKNTPLHRIQFGGRHERERRPGTENVPAAIAFARAAELATAANGNAVATLRDQFEQQLSIRLADIQINGAQSRRLPNTSNILFRGVSAEALVIALDMRQMAVSTGAACSSGSLEPSHVLLAMGLSRDDARSSIRFSFGRHNTAAEIYALTEAVVEAVEKLRRRNAKEARLAG